jgi:hypothetical protein
LGDGGEDADASGGEADGEEGEEGQGLAGGGTGLHWGHCIPADGERGEKPKASRPGGAEGFRWQTAGTGLVNMKRPRPDLRRGLR